MRLLKYLFCLVLFTGITMPLLSSCSDDDENGSAIEGYWVTGLEGENTPEMILFKGGKFVYLSFDRGKFDRGENVTAQKMKEWVDEAFETHKITHLGSLSDKYMLDYGTYSLNGDNLVFKFSSVDGDSVDGDDDDVERDKVSFKENVMVITWLTDSSDDEEDSTVYYRYTGE